MKNIILAIALASSMLFTTTFAADAGVEQFVNSGDLVQLDATDSIPDRDGEIIKYKWKQIKSKGTPKVRLSNKKTAKPTFIAPEVEEITEIVFKLKTKEIYNCKRVNKKGKKKGCKKYKSKDEVSVFVQPKDNNSTENNETNSTNTIYTVAGTFINYGPGTSGDIINIYTYDLSTKVGSGNIKNDGTFNITFKAVNNVDQYWIGTCRPLNSINIQSTITDITVEQYDGCNSGSEWGLIQ